MTQKPTQNPIMTYNKGVDCCRFQSAVPFDGGNDFRATQGPVYKPSGPVTQYYYGNASPPAPPISREQLLEAVHLASAELRHYSAEIAGMHLERAEVGQIVEWMRNADPKERLGMLLEQPGGGKTVVMRDVLVQLEAAGMPVLAIKADTLSGIESRAELADELGLPAPVEQCVRRLANEGLFFVLLDQLDALSLTLSRNQATLDVMLRTLSHLRTMPNVRIVASCRTFDLNNDPHLSTIKVDHKFELRSLDNEQVNRVLHAIRINPAHLLPAHRTLLTVPLNLYIYARIITSETQKQTPESYHTLQELYEGLWQKRISVILPNTPPPRERIQVIYKLVEVMKNRRQPKLTAPLATLDEYPEAAYYLKQVQIIRREKRNWLFFHQTFFDYCYARHFVAGALSKRALFPEANRRLGKSLTWLVSSKRSFWAIARKLRGLWIDQTDYQWQKHPVIRIDFSQKATERALGLKLNIKKYLHRIARILQDHTKQGTVL